MGRCTTRITAAIVVLACAHSAAAQCDPQEAAKLLADDEQVERFFGARVAISDNTAIVGAPGDDTFGLWSGAAYIFESEQDSWSQSARLVASDGSANAQFGTAVSIMNDVAIVGAWVAGRAYVFEIIDGQWTETALLPVEGSGGVGFGFSVDIYQDTIVVGDVWDMVDGVQTGAVYVYRKIGESWTEIDRLFPDDGAAGDNFGQTVAMNDDRIVLGSPFNDDLDDNSGSAYVFDLVEGEWVQTAKLLASDGEAGDQFGRGAIDVHGDTAIVQRPFVGTTYVYEYDHDTNAWTEAAQLTEPGMSAASLDGDLIVGGVPSANNSRGTGYLFQRVNGEWTRIAELSASDGVGGDQFGNDVAISGDHVIAGAPRDDDSGLDSGSAYIFALNCPMPTPALLDSCSITFGTTDNPPCDVANLVDNDDIDQILRSQFGFSAFERNLTEIVIEGNGTDATTMVSIDTREGSDTTNVVAKVKARNYTTNAIDDIAQYDVSFPSDDTSHTTPVNSAEFIKFNGDIEIRLRYVAPATFTPLGFTVGLDQVEVMVN